MFICPLSLRTIGKCQVKSLSFVGNIPFTLQQLPKTVIIISLYLACHLYLGQQQTLQWHDCFNGLKFLAFLKALGGSRINNFIACTPPAISHKNVVLVILLDFLALVS